MANNSEFLKLGDLIQPKQKGMDYDLIPGKTYTLAMDDWGNTIFKENGKFNMPAKVYQSKKDQLFMKRVLNYFNNTTQQNTGVLLAGTKGTGKSIQAKVIAKQSNLPIIIVDPSYHARCLHKFFNKFETPVCLIFDEVEKGWNTNQMLEFLDGIGKSTKKLVLMTCNEISNISEYMIDRCSRIRYLRTYSIEDNAVFIPALIKDMEIKNAEEVEKYCKENIKLLSMDNIVAFLKEVKSFEDEDITLDEIIDIMNISINGNLDLPENTIVDAIEIDEEEISEEEEDYDDEDDDDDY